MSCKVSSKCKHTGCVGDAADEASRLELLLLLLLAGKRTLLLLLPARATIR
jgi:hypothetical protein